MSQTVSTIVNRALKLAGVVPAGGTASAEDQAEAIDYLNELLASWKAQDVDLGMGESLTSSDTLYVDDSVLRAIRYNLAVDLTTAYPSNQPRVDIFTIAQSEKSMVFSQFAQVKESTFDFGLVGRKGFNINNGY